MNKKQLFTGLLALPLVISINVDAQQTSITKNVMQGLTTNASAVARKTATDLRIIGLTQFEYNSANSVFQVTDSTYLFYSGTRGSNLKTGEIKCDSAFSKEYNIGTGIYENNQKAVQTFDASDRVTSTINMQWDDVSNTYVETFRTTLTYNAQGKVETSIYQNWDDVNNVWENTYKNMFTYNGNGNEETDIEQTWNGTAWENSTKTTTTYNGDNTIASETFQNWDDLNGTWDNDERYQYVYVNGKLESMVQQVWPTIGSAWENDYRNTYTYDASGNRLTDEYQRWNGSAWDNVSRMTYTYDGNNNMLTEIDEDWDNGSNAYVKDDRTTYTYNSNNYPVTATMDTWNAGGFWEYTNGDTKLTYYYETYTTAAAELAKNSGLIQLYPVPARDEISLNISWLTPQSFTVNIYDAQGKLVSRQHEASTKQYRKKISTAELAPGNYFMNIISNDGFIETKRFNIIK